MNALPATTTDLSLELMLQDENVTGCENGDHDVRPEIHGGPARWYVKVLHDCPKYPGGQGEVRAYCDPFAQHIIYHGSWLIRCYDCQHMMQLRDMFQVLMRMR